MGLEGIKLLSAGGSSGSGGSSNSFETIYPPNGTSPVASSAHDQLTLTSSDNTITITGNSATDTVDFIARAAGATLSGIVTTGSQTIAGAKTFSGAISASNLSGTNTGDRDDLVFLRQKPYIWEDFTVYQAASSNGWLVTVSSGSCAPDYDNARSNGHPGIVSIATGVGATARAALWSPQREIVFDSTIGSHTYECMLKQGQTPVAGDDFLVIVGFADYIQMASVSFGAYFLVDKAKSTTNWQCVTRSAIAPTETVTDSGVAYDTNWHKMKIVFDSTDGYVYFYIDGNLITHHTANIPSNTKRVNLVQEIENISATVAHQVYVDYVFYQCSLTATR